MAKQIKIRVYPDGRIESETVGIKGKSCLGYIKEVENLTGARTVKSEFTHEYNETEQHIYTSNEEYQQNGH
ncbi:TPA: DUF2997 domain-containing protein [Candidatus Gastranaerophilales bacterium HUM_20]|nr:uncharacterized protein BN768_01610 [Clostridium sp. CAG:729]DAB21334.1 MAG TPA: DUF2997 domain-containing protein [Candidatus Gastranaerophilales bacterium HUM_20]